MQINNSNLPIASFPCSLVLIDDDEAFLYSLKRRLGQRHAVAAFSSTTQAFQHINQVQEIAEDTFELFEAYTHEVNSDAVGDDLVLIKSSKLETISTSKEKYRIISVAIIDQIMPRISGTEFCKQIENTGIKKILLTGQMTSPETIEAFNAGLIDGYISKSDLQATTKLLDLVSKLHQEYFEEKLAHVTKAFDKSHRQFLGNFAISRILEMVSEQFEFNEYFYSPTAPGFLLVDEKGGRKFCLISSDKNQRELADMMAEDHGEISQIESLRNGELVCWNLFHRPGNNAVDSLEFFSTRLFKCTNSHGYRWSLIPINETPFADDFQEIVWQNFKASTNQLLVNDSSLTN